MYIYIYIYIYMYIYVSESCQISRIFGEVSYKGSLSSTSIQVPHRRHQLLVQHINCWCNTSAHKHLPSYNHQRREDTSASTRVCDTRSERERASHILCEFAYKGAVVFCGVHCLSRCMVTLALPSLSL